MNKPDNGEEFGGFIAPDSRSTEAQVLADLILNPEYISRATAIINDSMFSDEAYRKTWKLLGRMSEDRRTIDLTTIGAKVDKSTLLALTSRTPGGTMTAIADHCEALRQVAIRRLVFLKSYEMLLKSAKPGNNLDELVSMPGKLTKAIVENSDIGGSTCSICDALKELADTLEADQDKAASGQRTRVPTGFSRLDRYTYGGLNAGNLVVLAARPSVGKTAIMLHMAKSATEAGVPATIYSLEMTRRELAQRLLFSTEVVKAEQISRNEIDWKKLQEATGMIDRLPLDINDTARTLDEICNDIVLGHDRGRCDIAFIDYLGLMSISDPKRLLYQEIAERTKRLKQLAKECQIPIVLLCQLNRSLEADGRPPQLSDLRDSGSIEQDADIVLMLERATRDLADRNVTMWIRKNRQGLAGSHGVRLKGNESFTNFIEVD